MTIPSGGILIGYARCSTDEQDLTAQRLAEQDPDLEPDRGLTGSAPKTSPGCANDSRAGRGASSPDEKSNGYAFELR